MDDAGTPMAEVTGIYLRRIQRRTVPLPLAQKVFDTEWVETPTPSQVGPATAAQPAGSWLVLSDDPDTKAIAEDFTAKFGSPTRRVIGADLSDESAVLEAFAETAADPDLSARGRDRLRRPELVRRHRLRRRAGARTRFGLGGFGYDSRGRRRLARKVAAALAGRPERSCGSRRRVGRTRRSADSRVSSGSSPMSTRTFAPPWWIWMRRDDVVATMLTELESSGSDDVIAWRGEQQIR